MKGKNEWSLQYGKLTEAVVGIADWVVIGKQRFFIEDFELNEVEILLEEKFRFAFVLILLSLIEVCCYFLMFYVNFRIMKIHKKHTHDLSGRTKGAILGAKGAKNEDETILLIKKKSTRIGGVNLQPHLLDIKQEDGIRFSGGQR